jgi:hypothetical protein
MKRREKERKANQREYWNSKCDIPRVSERLQIEETRKILESGI